QGLRVDYEVVVDRVFFCYVVEALQIVGPAGVRLSHELRCLLAVESFCGCDALRAYSLWSGDQNAQRLHLGVDGVRRGVRDDHDLAACSDLLDRVADEGADSVARQLRHEGVREDGLAAAFGEVVEQTREERFAPLFVGDRLRVDPGPLRRTVDDLLVDVEEAEPLGDEVPDVRAAGTGCMRDAHHVAWHSLNHATSQADQSQADRKQLPPVSPEPLRIVYGSIGSPALSNPTL